MSLLEKKRQGKETDSRPQDMPLSYARQQVYTALAAAWQEADMALGPWMGAPQAGVPGELQKCRAPGGMGSTFIQEKCPS